MRREFGEVLASGIGDMLTDRHTETDRHTDMLIAILRSPGGVKRTE